MTAIAVAGSALRELEARAIEASSLRLVSHLVSKISWHAGVGDVHEDMKAKPCELNLRLSW